MIPDVREWALANRDSGIWIAGVKVHEGHLVDAEVMDGMGPVSDIADYPHRHMIVLYCYSHG